MWKPLPEAYEYEPNVSRHDLSGVMEETFKPRTTEISQNIKLKAYINNKQTNKKRYRVVEDVVDGETLYSA